MKFKYSCIYKKRGRELKLAAKKLTTLNLIQLKQRDQKHGCILGMYSQYCALYTMRFSTLAVFFCPTPTLLMACANA